MNRRMFLGVAAAMAAYGCGLGGDSSSSSSHIDDFSDSVETPTVSAYSSDSELTLSGNVAFFETWITSLNGNRIYVKTIYPSAVLDGGIFPSLVVVPGALSSGASMLDIGRYGLIELASKGYIITSFNPQGRGSGAPGDPASEGVEDYNGFVHQDDLKCVIDALFTDTHWDGEKFGVISFSFGISIASGCLARYPELDVDFLIDIEGPSDNFAILGCSWGMDDIADNDLEVTLSELYGHSTIAKDSSQENVDWWAEREAIRFIGALGRPYMRIQAEYDHLQAPNETYPDGFDNPPLWYADKHAVDMVTAATNGNSPWTRVNNAYIGNIPNTAYSYKSQPLYFSGSLRMYDSSDLLQKSVEELWKIV